MSLLFTTAGTPGLAVVTTAETVLASITGVTLPRAGLPVVISAAGSMTIGASTTAVTLRCRRGVDATGALVGTAEVPTEVAANQAILAGSWVDTPGELANATYVVTVQQTAATGNGTDVTLTASALVGTPN
jgi:hypothetical protein